MAEVTTPIALIVFRRTDTLQKVVEELNKHSIKELFIIADGPRTPEEESETLAVRKLAETVKADRVTKVYSDSNVGLKSNLTSGVAEVLSKYERVIVLEDDCVPSDAFFESCEALGQEVTEDNRVAGFCGAVFLPPFSKQGLWASNRSSIWGWMTHRSVWQEFMESGFLEMSSDELTTYSSGLNRLPALAKWEIMRMVKRLDQLQSWAVPFEVFCSHMDYIFLKPKQNLVQNVGFDSSATHTGRLGERLSLPPTTQSLQSTKIMIKVSYFLDLVDHLSKYGRLVLEVAEKFVAGTIRNLRKK